MLSKAFDALFGRTNKPVRTQVAKPVSRYNYADGPMGFIGQQIVKCMENSGYPSRIFRHYRDPDTQKLRYEQGTSKAPPYDSPHQYYDAVDIIHRDYAWFHPSLCPPTMTQEQFARHGKDYWDTLAAVVRTIEAQYGIDLVHGHDWGWDSAHIELKDWRDFKAVIGKRPPTSDELALRFEAVLPRVWKRHRKSASAGGHK